VGSADRCSFQPGNQASGIAHPGFYTVVWYRRTFRIDDFNAGERMMLNFEAVDYSAIVWVNGATSRADGLPFGSRAIVEEPTRFN